jgi:RND family efflux transporter MFP subunit
MQNSQKVAHLFSETSSIRDRGAELDSLILSDEQRRGKFSLGRVVLAITIAGMVSLPAFWWLTGAELPFVKTPAPVSAKLVEPEQAPPTLTRESLPAPVNDRVVFEAQGFITATRSATVSSRVLGIVKDVLVEEGQWVKEGSVLAHLDDTDARMDLGLAEARLLTLKARRASAEAEYTKAKIDYQRERVLFEKKISSKAQKETLRTAVDVAAAALKNARAEERLALLQVEQQRQQLEDYVIRAPFNGVVVAKNAQPGEVLAPTGASGGFTRTGIYTVTDMTSLEVLVDVSEQMIAKVREGAPAEIQLYAYNDLVVPGRVLQVMPVADRAKGTLRVRVALLGQDPRIVPEMGAKVGFLSE